LQNPFSRRRFVSATLATAAALKLTPKLFAATCNVTPEQETGPFYIADELLRSNISEGRPGIPLALEIKVLDSRTCRPIPNAAIDLWHCDASGLYSGYTQTSLGPPPGSDNFHPDQDHPGFNGPPPDGHGPPNGPPPNGGPPAMSPTDKLTFCRGIQLTSAEGAVHFNTIFPGFYQGRVNHIHMKVRLDGQRTGDHYAAGHTGHTGQLFFPEDLTAQLMQQEPYRSHHIHRTTIAEDGVYNSQGGSAAVAVVSSISRAYRAQLTLNIDPTQTPKPVGVGGPRPPRA